jgi:hypothetical protein
MEQTEVTIVEKGGWGYLAFALIPAVLGGAALMWDDPEDSE